MLIRMIMLLGLLMGTWAMAAEPLAKVYTLEQLQKQPPLSLPGGGVVRLGYCDGGADSGPWALVYCLCSGDARHLAITSNSLGPVQLEAKWGDQLRMEQDAKMKVPANAGKEPYLYCGAVLLHRKGTCHIAIQTLEHKVLAETDIKVEQPRACYWYSFAQFSRQGDEQLIITRKTPFAAYPCYDGTLPVMSLGETKLMSPERLPSITTNCLPGAIPLKEEWMGYYTREMRKEPADPLQLMLKDNQFITEARSLKMLDWPDTQLLARWWVNGKAIVPPIAEVQEAEDMARQLTIGKQMQVTFGLPDTLGELKVGDKVALQVLYVPDGYEALPKSAIQQEAMKARRFRDNEDTIPVPMLSNRLEFTLTAAMLAGRSIVPR